MQTSATIFVLTVFLTGSDSRKLTALNSCTCLGYEAVFECVVTGDGATVWQGTAFDECSSDRIVLRHSEFNYSGYSISQICGTSGQLFSRAVSIVNESYASHLTVNVSEDFVGKTVECGSDNGFHIGTKQISLTTAPLQPPSNVELSLINSNNLTFTWNSASPNCRVVHYKINATNCGLCPNTTDTNSVTCSIPNDIAVEQICEFTVQTMVCGKVPGVPSEPIVFVMKAPHVPRVNVTSEYSGEAKKLTKIYVTVELIASELDAYNVTEFTYTINYTDIASGNSCGSTILPASSCDDGICTSVFEVSSSLCQQQADISVSAFATNVFGNGLRSDGILINAINHFLDIDFDFIATNAIKCTFMNHRATTLKSCAIKYGPKVGTQCTNLSLSSRGNSITSDTVNINLHPSTKYEIEYCYHLIASDGISTVFINGTFAACNPDQLNNGESAQDDVVCGASYNALGIEKGFICYSGSKVGSTAVHYCYDCGLNFYSVQESVGPLIRMCGQNGQWNGSTPQCECSHFTVSDLALFIGGFGGIVALIFTVTVTIFVTIIIVLCKAKARLNKQLQHCMDAESKIYEEIDQMPQPKMDTEDNIAYISCHSIMRSVSCSYKLT